jgi:hypothetical protein
MSKNTNLSFLTDYITADITNGRIGINTPSPAYAFDVTGATKITGVLTLTSTISNGTYTYTLPSATGTLALTSALSGYLPLTGGTLTGALGGTSASFTGAITTANDVNLTSSAYVYSSAGGSGVRSGIFLNGASQAFNVFTAGTSKLEIASTGAATFSSSVMVNGSTVSTEGLSVQYNQAKTYTTQTAVSRWHSNESSGSQFKLNLFAIGNATGSSRVFSFQTSNEGVANDGIISLQEKGGNVGIGSTTPSFKLETLGTSAIVAGFGRSDYGASNVMLIGMSGYRDVYKSAIGVVRTGDYDVGNMIFCLNSAANGTVVSASDERMRITSGGNLLVGTTTDSGSLITASSYSTSSKSKISENATTVAANTATTIFAKPAGNGGAFVLVTGRTAANNWFFDTVVFNSYNSATNLSSNNGGSPPSRSYSVSADNLQVTVSTALDNIYCFGLTAKY